MAENIDIKKKGNKITIVVEIDEKGRPSSTGKSTILYTTGGYSRIEGDIGISMTVIRYKKKDKK